jgi:hypothetical protein
MNPEELELAAAIGATLRESWRAPVSPFMPVPDLPTPGWVARLIEGGVAGLAWWRIRGTPLASDPGVADLHAAFRHHAVHAARQERDLEHVLVHFNEAGLEPIVFKGWALSRLYPHRALRPFGDFDLLVRHADADRARSVLRSLPSSLQERADVDTALTLRRYLPDRTEAELWAHSRTEQLGQARFRVLAAEDHLRLVALHQLHHGGYRPLWLCDLAVLVESLPGDFDWGRCLAGDRSLSEGVGAALGLAAELLGARLPPGAPVVAPPAWLREAVWRGWVRGYDTMPPPLYELHTLGFRGALRAMRARWPDPVSATVHLRAPFRRIPRVLVQSAEVLRRAFDFVRRDVRWRVGIDAQLANVGKGVVP